MGLTNDVSKITIQTVNNVSEGTRTVSIAEQSQNLDASKELSGETRSETDSYNVKTDGFEKTITEQKAIGKVISVLSAEDAQVIKNDIKKLLAQVPDMENLNLDVYDVVYNGNNKTISLNKDEIGAPNFTIIEGEDGQITINVNRPNRDSSGIGVRTSFPKSQYNFKDGVITQIKEEGGFGDWNVTSDFVNGKISTKTEIYNQHWNGTTTKIVTKYDENGNEISVKRYDEFGNEITDDKMS